MIADHQCKGPEGCIVEVSYHLSHVRKQFPMGLIVHNYFEPLYAPVEVKVVLSRSKALRHQVLLWPP